MTDTRSDLVQGEGKLECGGAGMTAGQNRDSDIVERLREPVMLRYSAEQINAERKEAANEIERLRGAAQACTHQITSLRPDLSLRCNLCGKIIEDTPERPNGVAQTEREFTREEQMPKFTYCCHGIEFKDCDQCSRTSAQAAPARWIKISDAVDRPGRSESGQGGGDFARSGE